jgi:alpha-L-fucosidase 2
MICGGSTIDMEILRALFEEYATAAKVLGLDEDLRDKVLQTRERLAPLQIGKNGELQEWLDDWESLEPQHRHLSHLWGLYPGDHITPRSSSQILAGARKSLEARGEGGCGWSNAWKVNLWARLLDGERAFKSLEYLFTKNTLPDLFSLCGKAMQVDGNFGGAAGIGEMLVQTYGGEITLLPALPKAWPEGRVRGIRARGGFELEFAWKAGKLSGVTVHSLLGKPCTLRYNGKVKGLATAQNGTYTLDADLQIK